MVASGEQVWADRYDASVSTSELFAIRDKIIRQVVATVGDYYGKIPRNLARASRHKAVNELSAYEAVLQNLHYVRILDQESHTRTRAALEHAVKIEPDYASAWAMLGALYGDIHAYRLSELEHPLDRAIECANRAVFLDPTCQYAHYTQTFLAALKHDRQQLVEEAEIVLELNPNSAFMVGAAGVFLGLVGDFERALALIETSKKLNPHFPGWFHYISFLFHYENGDYVRALAAAYAMNMPTFFWDPLVRAAARMRLGQTDKAAAAYRELIHLRPDFSQHARNYTSCFVLNETVLEQMLADFNELARQISG